MTTAIVYRECEGWLIGHLQQYPEFESQGKNLDELKENLADIYHDISAGLVPDAQPAMVAELVV
jgi:hypothetical protein